MKRSESERKSWKLLSPTDPPHFMHRNLAAVLCSSRLMLPTACPWTRKYLELLSLFYEKKNKKNIPSPIWASLSGYCWEGKFTVSKANVSAQYVKECFTLRTSVEIEERLFRKINTFLCPLTMRRKYFYMAIIHILRLGYICLLIFYLLPMHNWSWTRAPSTAKHTHSAPPTQYACIYTCTAPLGPSQQRPHPL